ncbi:MAG: creatininase family protein [Chloroflexi bacterium]|nr:creatininase family protein [Chloroflexota bacterium]
MSQPVSQKYLFADLTWPEVNEAVAMEKVILLPVGSTEQHGHHLPLDVDNFLASSVCLEAGRRAPEKILVAPNIPYGFNIHAMDFPGTIHVAYDHFVEYCTDVCKSFAYHGFKRIVIVDGHGSNEHLLEFVGRKTILETDALVASFMWWNLLRKDPAFVASFRESAYPGGVAHACEVETSMYLHLNGEKVQMDKAADHFAWYNDQGTEGFQYVDAFGGGPVAIVEWTSTYTPRGVMGQPTLATAEKGKRIFEEAVTRLVEFTDFFQKRPAPPRVDHHTRPPTSPLPKA